jgi:hypothetical protein
MAGYGQLYEDIVDRRLSWLPMDQLDRVKSQIHSLGYRTRIRWRGPRIGTDGRHTLKRHARAFTVYIKG